MKVIILISLLCYSCSSALPIWWVSRSLVPSKEGEIQYDHGYQDEARIEAQKFCGPGLWPNIIKEVLDDYYVYTTFKCVEVFTPKK